MKIFSRYTNIALWLSFSLALGACSITQNSASVSETSKAIEPYCSPTSNTFNDAITVSGNAGYQYRQNGNGAVVGPSPIRYAQVEILNAQGVKVQCTETDATGKFSLQIPRNTGTYTLSVVSRAYNSHYNAYILTNPTDNSAYAVTVSIDSSTTQAGVNLVAPAKNTLEGGAFNILDQILNANEFLRTYTANCNQTGSSNLFQDCTPFTTAPIVYVYWAKGVNPGSYFGISGGLSFYIPGRSQLYVLGGLNGDTDYSDTDHFDNSVIIHEYGHFIEDHFGHMDSPGGSHDGNSVIDPRLAWGEGWADFFQAAVTGNPIYMDTKGNIDGTSTIAFSENIESGTRDKPVSPGEGIFHEFSISRLLWDAIDPHPASGKGGTDGGTDLVQDPFSAIWTIVTGKINGFAATTHHFRSINLLHKLQEVLTGSSNWSSLRTLEKQANGMHDYANPLTLDASCSPTTLTPVATYDDIGNIDGSYAATDLLRNNDFYIYEHSGGTLDIVLNYTTSNANPADLDLYLYREGYTYGTTTDMAGQSRQSLRAASGTETINQAVAPGFYIINVMAFTGTPGPGAAAQYNLTINGHTACPTP